MTKEDAINAVHSLELWCAEHNRKGLQCVDCPFLVKFPNGESDCEFVLDDNCIIPMFWTL